MRFAMGVTLGMVIAACAGAVVLAPARACSEPTPPTIQLVGNFNGITCEPDDPANDMELMGDGSWRKLKFIDEPTVPDTIFFKFTLNGSYLPMHWGWSGVWGIAAFEWSPPSIAAVLPDSGYYYFHFKDTDYTYWIDRPAGRIFGAVSAEKTVGVPAGACVILYDAGDQVIGACNGFVDSTYSFDALPTSVYRITAHAPGFRDTTITGIALGIDEVKNVPIHLREEIGVLIASAECRRTEGGVLLDWCTMGCDGYATFDVYRGYEPSFTSMERRNLEPILSTRVYEFFDRCDDPTRDLYYYLVERASENPTHYGPLLVKGEPAAVLATLAQNYPNPFNPSTTVPYTIGTKGAGSPVVISFYDVAGRLIERHDLGAKGAGSYTFRWSPAVTRGGSFPSGVYYCRLTIGKEIHTRTLILLR